MEHYKHKISKVEDLIPYALNSREHSDLQVAQISASIREFGFTNPVLIDEENNLIAGHGRVLAARKLNLDDVPAITITGLDERKRRALVIADNKLALNADWNDESLKIELEDLATDFGELMGFSGDELAEILGLGEEPENVEHGALAARFGVPPFSILNARDGWWQARKRGWLSLGIKSEKGREDVPPTSGRAGFNFNSAQDDKINHDGGSIFCPVLSELAYTWFSPKNGVVLDPFAGGSVRGVVAGKLGRKYVGVELRGEQVEANKIQGEELFANSSESLFGDAMPEQKPEWIQGDSGEIDKLVPNVEADFLFSCPPYADLEVYSDDPKDISGLSYEDFKPAYLNIITKACAKLKEDRFACFVVGDVRDKNGNYYNFVGDTVECFKAAGLHYYNEAIMVTPIGTLPIRAGRQFDRTRKLGKGHQNVLVFVKGNGKKAAANLEQIDRSWEDFVEEDLESAE